MKITFSVVFLLFASQILAQRVSLYGSISDASTSEHLIGATIVTDNNKYYTTTNSFGFYSLPLQKGTYNIYISYLGYNDTLILLNLENNKQLNMKLKPKTINITEVSINAKGNNVKHTLTGLKSINIKTINNMPVLTGEKDVVMSLQTLPGISAGNEGTTSISVRGGSADQNLFLLDDAPVYNASHALGFFSVFNTSALNNVKVYTGSFPAEYGGRLSSVIDLRMRDGNKQKLSGELDLGLISSRATIEGPIVKGQSSYMISGRYCYAGYIANQLDFLNTDLSGSTIQFYDINAKFNTKINNNNHLYFSVYTGNDNFYSKIIDLSRSTSWGNNTFTLRWNHVFNPKLFVNYTATYSQYGYKQKYLNDVRNCNWLASLKHAAFKADFNYYPALTHKIKYGISFGHHTFEPGKIEASDSIGTALPVDLGEKSNLQLAIYLGDTWEIMPKLELYLGLRYSNMLNIGSGYEYEINYTNSTIEDSVYIDGIDFDNLFQNIEPRFSLRYSINTQNSFKVSYSRNTQYFHLLSSSSVALPTDIWLPANNNLKPQYAHIYSAGYYNNIFNKNYEFSTEIYYKHLNNVIDFRDNANIELNPYVDLEILSGYGRAYGIELSFEKTKGSLTGWINYTLSRNERKIDGINNNNFYHTRYDKLHNMNVSLAYSINKYWQVASNFKLASGGYISMPEGTYTVYGYAVNYYTKRNGYKLPLYHRLDLSLTYLCKNNYKRRHKSQWNLSVYNVYNRHNIFSLYTQFGAPGESYRDDSKTYNLYLFGIVPTISYNLKF